MCTVPFSERGGKARGCLDLVSGRYPAFVFGGGLGAFLPVFHFHEVTREEPFSGTEGRRSRREPDPVPVRDGSQTEPWLYGHDTPPVRESRTASPQYLIDTGEQDWATALDDDAEQRDGGRHSGSSDGSPTVRLQALLGELDPNRPRRRHRR